VKKTRITTRDKGTQQATARVEKVDPEKSNLSSQRPRGVVKKSPGPNFSRIKNQEVEKS
jgi:hypothetical protein